MKKDEILKGPLAAPARSGDKPIFPTGLGDGKEVCEVKLG